MSIIQRSVIDELEQLIIVLHSEVLTHQEDTGCADGMKCPKLIAMQQTLALLKDAKARYHYGKQRLHSVFVR